MSHDDDEPVGPGMPPKKHQWPKGTSGNLKGRPKGAKSFKTVVVNAARSKVTVVINGVPKKMTGVEAQVHVSQMRGLKGATASEGKMLALFEQFMPEEQVGAQGLTPDEITLLRDHAYFVELLSSATSDEKSEPSSPTPAQPATKKGGAK